MPPWGRCNEKCLTLLDAKIGGLPLERGSVFPGLFPELHPELVCDAASGHGIENTMDVRYRRRARAWGTGYTGGNFAVYLSRKFYD